MNTEAERIRRKERHVTAILLFAFALYALAEMCVLRLCDFMPGSWKLLVSLLLIPGGIAVFLSIDLKVEERRHSHA